MIGIMIGLLLLVFLAYKGYSIIWVAPVSALVVAAIGGLELLPAYTETYMTGLVNFVGSYFPMFMLGAVFGKLMEITGAASSVAGILIKMIGTKRAVLAVVISCAVLTYGGVSLFVVVFAIYPLAIELFRGANIPRRLIPGSIALGSFTFTMTAMPGTPQLNNIIPQEYFGTDAMAGTILGITASIIMFVSGYAYLSWRQRKLANAGEVFDEPKKFKIIDKADLPNPYLSLIPLVTVVITLNVFKSHIVVALLAGIACVILLNITKAKDFITAFNEGASGSVQAIVNTAAAVGFGAIVKAVPGFAVLSSILLGLEGSPMISLAIAVTILAGATGSSSGGMGIALGALGTQYMEIANQMNINPEAFHRIASIASGGLDSLPHCGAVITLLAVTEMKHKDSYGDIGIITCVIPLVATVVVILMGTVGIV